MAVTENTEDYQRLVNLKKAVVNSNYQRLADILDQFKPYPRAWLRFTDVYEVGHISTMKVMKQLGLI